MTCVVRICVVFLYLEKILCWLHQRRLFEHNVSEKFLKTGKGRLELQKFVENFVSGTS